MTGAGEVKEESRYSGSGDMNGAGHPMPLARADAAEAREKVPADEVRSFFSKFAFDE